METQILKNWTNFLEYELIRKIEDLQNNDLKPTEFKKIIESNFQKWFNNSENRLFKDYEVLHYRHDESIVKFNKIAVIINNDKKVTLLIDFKTFLNDDINSQDYAFQLIMRMYRELQMHSFDFDHENNRELTIVGDNVDFQIAYIIKLP